MKQISSEYKNNVKLFGRELDSIITYEQNNETIELGSEQLNSVVPHYEGNILKSVMKQLDIDSNVEIPIGTILNYQFGIKTGVDEETDENIYEYINYGNYIVKNIEKQEDTSSYKITCYDKMLYSMIPYEDMSITYPITIRDYINAICTKLGLTFKNASDIFANYNRQIQTELYLDNGGNSLNYTFRDVLDELAEVTASTICINENTDQLEIRYINTTNDIINEEYLKDVNVNFGEKYGPVNSVVLSRSAESDNVYIKNDISIEENGLCEIKIVDNQIMNFNDRADYLPDIFSKLGGLEYYLNDFSSTGITYYELCDRYTVQIGNQYYSCVMFNDEVDITQGLEEQVHTDRPDEGETDYTKSDKTDIKINQTYLIVDKQNQAIESVISNVTEQDDKISQISQTVDELNSKISDIADITISGESNFATFTLDNINESEPIIIKVKPISDNISYLYPRSNLYPSNSLYSKTRVIRFTNKDEYELTTDTIYQSYNTYYSYDSTDDEYTLLVAGTDYTLGDTITGDVYQHKNYDYTLPDDLLIYDQNTYDEFYLDYDSQTCRVIKRCKYNADGTVGLLSQEQRVDYPYPTIALTDGDYILSLIGYQYGYLFVRLMAKNIYTSQFYTKVETDSHINQKATEIELGVNQTLMNYPTNTEMNSAISIKADEINSVVSTKVGNDEIISKINQSAEQIQINADKISLEGKTINMTSDDINISSTNFNVNKDGRVSISATNDNNNLTLINTYSINGKIFKNLVSGMGMSCSDENNIELMSLGFGIDRGFLQLRNANTNNNIIQIYPNNIYAQGGLDISGGNLKNFFTYSTTISSSPNMYVGSDGIFKRSTSSSKRYKKDIKNVSDEELDIDKLLEVPIRQFKYKEDYISKDDKKYNKDIIGFIVEELEKYYPIAVDYNEEGQPEMWNSQILIPAMLGLIQKLEKRISTLEKESDK